MKSISLDVYEPNVSCPHCLEGDVASSQWYTDQELKVWQRCGHCGKVCEEIWTLTKVQLAETEEEEQSLAFLHDHPECVA